MLITGASIALSGFSLALGIGQAQQQAKIAKIQADGQVFLTKQRNKLLLEALSLDKSISSLRDKTNRVIFEQNKNMTNAQFDYQKKRLTYYNRLANTHLVKNFFNRKLSIANTTFILERENIDIRTKMEIYTKEAVELNYEKKLAQENLKNEAVFKDIEFQYSKSKSESNFEEQKINMNFDVINQDMNNLKKTVDLQSSNKAASYGGAASKANSSFQYAQNMAQVGVQGVRNVLNDYRTYKVESKGEK